MPNYLDDLRAYGQRLQSIPEQADRIAEETFPGSARDSSTKNAFRHSLGTGMLTREWGGGALGAALAKAAGYGWEALGGTDNLDPVHRTDTLHDLNANAIGAMTARQVGSHQELVDALKRLSLQSVPVQPPGVFSPSPGYLTRSVP